MLTDFADDRTEYAAWKQAITHTHQRRVWGRVLDLEHRRVSVIDDILDGQISIDVDSEECTRELRLTLLDEARSIGWEPDSPSSLPRHLRRMVQIFDERYIPDFGIVTCPAFCGPVAEVDRDGAEVFVVAEGKERLALGSFGATHHWAKRRKVTDVIREILELAGEAPSRIHLPALNNTMPKELNVQRADTPWKHAKRLAASVDCVLFYDGRGHVRMRRQPTKPTLTLDKDWLLAPVRIDRPKLEFHNGWIINGPKPAGNKDRITSGLVGLPKNNDFSAYSLRRSGAWRWIIEEEEIAQVKTKAKALEIAHRRRDERIRFAADISLDCLPFPNVEEWDLLKAVDPLTGTCLTRVRQATLPLVGGDMTIGAVVRVSRGPRKATFHPAQHGGLR